MSGQGEPTAAHDCVAAVQGRGRGGRGEERRRDERGEERRGEKRRGEGRRGIEEVETRVICKQDSIP